MSVLRRLRVVARDLTVGRITAAVERRVRDIPHHVAWHVPTAERRRNLERLERYRNLHAGERCFVLGNGPSLGRMDLSPLAGEITFGLNRIYLLFEKLGFTTTYFVCLNELVLEQFADDIAKLPMPKFLNWDRRGAYDRSNEQTMFLRLHLGLSDHFVSDPSHAMSAGGTVTYGALQLAYFMGFSEVILLGVDHNFVDKGTPNRTAVRQGRDDNHFHPNYFPAGSKWQLPDLPRSELAYAEARRAFMADGRRILDATVGGKCPSFDRIDFEKLVVR